MEEKEQGERWQPPSLQELCIKSVAVHLNLFQKLNEVYLPPAAVQSILRHYREEVKQRTSKLTDDNIGVYLSLLEAEAFESEAGVAEGAGDSITFADGYGFDDDDEEKDDEDDEDGASAQDFEHKDQEQCGDRGRAENITRELSWWNRQSGSSNL